MVAFELNQEQKLARKMFRDFAQNEVKPLVREMDEAEAFDMGLLAKMKRYGLMGIPYGKEYGGAGADVLTYALCMEEMSKVDASVGITISVHTSLCCSCLAEYASEEQKQTFLRPLVDGTKVGCFGLTEPSAGTDAGGVLTTAEKDGDHYVLNGQKVFTTNSGFADTFIIFALTNKALGGIKGMSAFIVARDMPGLEVSKDIPHGYPGGLQLRGGPHRRAGARRPAHRQGGHGLQDRYGRPGRRPYRHRGPGRWHCPGRHRRGAHLRQGAQAVRQSYCQIPEHPVPAG